MEMKQAPAEGEWSENNLEDGGGEKEEREGGRIKRKKVKMVIIHIPQGCGKL